MLRRFRKDESAATMIEYGLIVALLALAIVGALGRSSNVISNNFYLFANVIANSTTE